VRVSDLPCPLLLCCDSLKFGCACKYCASAERQRAAHATDPAPVCVCVCHNRLSDSVAGPASLEELRHSGLCAQVPVRRPSALRSLCFCVASASFRLCLLFCCFSGQPWVARRARRRREKRERERERREGPPPATTAITGTADHGQATAEHAPGASAAALSKSGPTLFIEAKIRNFSSGRQMQKFLD
jgi:hypothetical protein